MSAKRRRTTQRSASAVEFLSGSVEETQAFGERIGCLLRAGDVVALEGELGSGKTTLIQGMARGLGRDPDTVKSPTFILVREYPGEVPLVHVDGYRLDGPPAASWLDLDLLFAPQKVTLIEWAERFVGLLPEHYLAVRLSHVSTNRRRFQLVPFGPRAAEFITHLRGARVGRGQSPAGGRISRGQSPAGGRISRGQSPSGGARVSRGQSPSGTVPSRGSHDAPGD